MTATNRVGRYEILRKLAVGGMAEVYLAKMDGPAGFQKTVVLKRILPNLAKIESFANMFLNEARLAAVLNHPNIVQIIELGQEGETYFIAMEYIDGPSVGGLMRAAAEKKTPLPCEIVAKIVSQACEGLEFAHESVGPDGEPLKLIHRDISPDNVLLARSGSVKVADFGIAKAANLPSVTQTGMLKGKISYLPPEAFTGKPIDQRADIFAMGVVLYEMLTGTKPFKGGGQVEVMESILHDKPKPLSSVRPDAPSELQAVVDKALSKDLGHRYRNPGAMQSDLESFLMHRQSPVRSADIAGLITQLVPARNTGGFQAVAPAAGAPARPASSRQSAIRPSLASEPAPEPAPKVAPAVKTVPARPSFANLEALALAKSGLAPPEPATQKISRPPAASPTSGDDNEATILNMPSVNLDDPASVTDRSGRAITGESIEISSSSFEARVASSTEPRRAPSPFDPVPARSAGALEPHRGATPTPEAAPTRRKSIATLSPADERQPSITPGRRQSVANPLGIPPGGQRPSTTPRPSGSVAPGGDDLIPTERALRSMVDPASGARVPDTSPSRPAARSGLRVPLLVGAIGVAVCVLIVVGLRVFAPGLVGSESGGSDVQVASIEGTRLLVESEPAGADVFVQTTRVGATPLNVENTFPAGSRLTLSVSIPGVAPVVTQIEGGRGQVVHATLRAPARKK